MDGRIRETDWTDRQDQLVELLPLVTFLAKELVKKLPRQVEIDDLVQDGIFGAAGALRTFDPTRGVKLRSYAALRIRGAMLDGLRSRREGARNHHTCGLVPAIRSIDSMTEKAGDMLIEDEGSAESLDELEHRDQVRAMLRILDRRSRMVVVMHELDGLTMKEIGQALGVCESRVSQLHTAAMATLRQTIKEDKMPKGDKDVDIDEEAYNATDEGGKASCNDRIAELPAPTPAEEAEAHAANIEWMRARTAGEIPMDTPAPPTAVERAIQRINATKEAQMPKRKYLYEVDGQKLTADDAADKIGCKPGSVQTMTREDGIATIRGKTVTRVEASETSPAPAKKKRAARVQTVGLTDQDDQRTPVRVVEDNIQELLDELQRERDAAIDAIHDRFNAQKDALERLRTHVA